MAQHRLAGPANQQQPIRPAGAMQRQPLQEYVASSLPPLGVTMDDHLFWYIHRRHPFGSSSACFFSQAGHTKTNPHPAPGHKRHRAGPKSSRGDRPSETRIRAFRQGWKGRILASIPARPTTRAHTTQAPPHLRAPRRGWINSRSVAPAGWPVPGHASGRRQQRAALLAAY